ncbi:branched-chain amino acid ABC transporter substrate-binding protein [Frigoriglobus tundricola]|uniref:Branched-chain amino acid ABC transporter, substrate-binding protein LivJ n=1 Tax=Frigoriglobus tundricola TaxID=2774151 RepID=A0A6M5YH00_9BACT|nr:branched-chain amino acid ABC transporter substrate-binding protein [Frigoriglobus tundricola]QJW93307.1 Branched-chain amino acid ABC transporter, substrate-binding protein LivJ [Frigoriglobus tundricola]
MDRRKFLGVAGLTAAGAGVFLAGGCGGNSNTLKIVSSLPRTGSAQGQTDTIVNGIRLAMDEYNNELFGHKLVHQDMDDATAAQGQWDAGKEADNAREAISDKNVMVFIGPYNSGAAKQSMPILSEAGLLQISPAATWPGLTKVVPGDEKSGEPGIYRKSDKLTFCRVCPTDNVQGPKTAEFVARVLNAKTVFVLDDKELYGSGIAKLFMEACRTKEIGIKILGHEQLVKQNNYKATLQKIAQLKPDAIYFGGTSQSGGPQIAIDMKGENLTCPLIVPDGCYEKAFIEGAGADLFKDVTCYATIGGKDPSLLTTGAGAEFVKKYKEKFNKDPEAYAVYGYEAAKVFLEAAKAVGRKDREAIRDAVIKTKDFDKGALGKWSFDADGDTTLQELTISKIENGKFKPVKSL